MKKSQRKTPYFDALKKYLSVEVSPFDVPGHHMGNVPNKLKTLVGENVFRADVNAPIGMDNLAAPRGPLLEAQRLMADFCGASRAFFLINGTTSGIIAMIMTACRANDRIILPRNVHKSIINALVLSGAIPTYIMPRLDSELEIANQPSVDDYVRAMNRYPSAKAIFVINPTYFGSVIDLKQLVEIAHARGIAVLVDEAHGAHYYFNKNGPLSAMECGADMSSVSFHKTGGSLTQSSVLLLNEGIFSRREIQKTLNILNTTSPNTLLLASLDTAREYVAMHGQANMNRVFELSDFAREQIDKIKGFKTVGKDHFVKYGSYDYDKTKLVIALEHLDINGFELYKLLKVDYNIQVELAETYVIMAILAIGTKKKHILALIKALKDISRKHYKKSNVRDEHSFGIDFPYMLMRPRLAYHADGKKVPLEKAVNEIAKEQLMIYPPGIPLIVPGEVFTKELVDRIKTYKKMNGTILSDYKNADNVSVIDRDKWQQFHLFKNKLNDYLIKKITTPRGDDYVMPFEGEAHEGTIILLPFRKDTWRENAKLAQNAYRQVIMAIAKYEKVYVGIHPSIYNSLIDSYKDVDNIVPIKIRYNDAWARDNCPIFVINKENKMRAVDFRFNAWGGEVDGLYNNYKEDDLLAKAMAKYFGVERYYLENFVLEGGSIHVDGKGTCLVTEACLLSNGRNPHLNKLQIEETLKIYLNVSKVIWLKHGIYLDETNEHVDNIACFVRPGVIALAWTNDKNDPQYEYSLSCYNILKKEHDAEGNPFKIVKIINPEPIYTNKEDTKGIQAGRYSAVPRLVGSRLAASYINFYQGEKFVIMPGFGVKEDGPALKRMKQLFPEKDVIQINSREILLGGGNIHCITMQVPKTHKGE